MTTRPPRGTSSHIQWVLNKVLEVAAKLGTDPSLLSRDKFIEETRGEASRRDIDAMGITWPQIREFAKDSVIRGVLKSPDDVPLDPVPEGYFVKSVSTQVDALGDVERQWVKAPLSQAPGSLTTQVPDGHTISGVSTLVSGDGHTLAQWIKTKEKSKELSLAELLEKLLAEIPTSAPARSDLITPPHKALDSDLMACVVLGDGHVGLCSWAQETGADWDLKIAEEIHRAAVSDLVSRGPDAEVGMLVELGDWLDSDGVNNTTTSGTPQDTDTRWDLVVGTGLRIMIHAVDCMLAKHQRVIVDVCQGNHNRSSSTIFAHYVAAWYRNEPRVEVIMNPSTRHYHQWGSCLLGTTHGDGPKTRELPEVMAAEVPELWGSTKHRRWFVGHVHHSTAVEHRGCVVETFRTLSPRSSWAAAKGYVAKRDASRITYHKEFGEISREICSAEYLASQLKKS